MPDQPLALHAQDAVSTLAADASAITKQKKTANHQKKKDSARTDAEALDIAENGQQRKKRRSTRAKAVPDVAMLDGVISDSEQGEEEEEGSDAEFVARPKGSKQVRLSAPAELLFLLGNITLLCPRIGTPFCSRVSGVSTPLCSRVPEISTPLCSRVPEISTPLCSRVSAASTLLCLRAPAFTLLKAFCK